MGLAERIQALEEQAKVHRIRGGYSTFHEPMNHALSKRHGRTVDITKEFSYRRAKIATGGGVSASQKTTNRKILQLAINAGSDALLSLPEGLFLLDDEPVLVNNLPVRLFGAGAFTVLQQQADGAVFQVEHDEETPFRLEINGITYKTSATTASQLVSAEQVRELILTDCRIVGASYYNKLVKAQYCAQIEINSPKVDTGTVARIQNSTDILISDLFARSTQPMTDSQNADMAVVNIEYSDNWTVDGANIANYVHGIQWWGGDARNGTDNALNWIGFPADRQCRNGIVKNIIGRNQYYSLVWGSMGEGIKVSDSFGENCGDVTFDSEGGDDVVFENLTIKDGGWRTGAGNLGAFYIQRGIQYKNITSIVSDATIIHEAAGVDPNIPAGKSKYNHQFFANDYAGLRHEGLHLEDIRFITLEGVSNWWTYGHFQRLFVKGCYFKNVLLNDPNKHYSVIVEDNLFELTNRLVGGGGFAALVAGQSKEGTTDVYTFEGDDYPFLQPDGIEGRPGYTSVRRNRFAAAPGTVDFEDEENMLASFVQLMDEAKNQHVYIEENTYVGCNIDIKTQTDIDQTEARAIISIKNNTGNGQHLLLHDTHEPVYLYQNNRTLDARVRVRGEVFGAHQLTKNAESTGQYYVLGLLPPTGDGANFAKASFTVHGVIDTVKPYSYRCDFASRGGISRFTALTGLYDLSERKVNVQLFSHTSGDIWVVLHVAAGYHTASLDIHSWDGYKEPPGTIHAFEEIPGPSAPDFTPEYSTDNEDPQNWQPQGRENWQRVRELDSGSAGIPERYGEILYSPIKEQLNVYFVPDGETDKVALIPDPNDLDATQRDALNFGFMTRGGFDYNKIHDLDTIDLLNLLWSLIEFRYGISPA